MATKISLVSSPQFLLVAAIALLLLYKLSRLGRRDKHLPPGPPTLPILGNAHLIPLKNVHKKFKEWSDQYGTIFSLKIGKTTMIVLNDRQAVHELIDKKGANFKDRSFDSQVIETFNDLGLGVMHASPLWKAQRKIASQMMTASRLDGPMREIRDAEISLLMHDLLEDPENFSDHIRRSTASAASIVIFGQRAKTRTDFWARCPFVATKATNDAIGLGSYIPTDQFPILDLIPYRWNPATKQARRSRETHENLWRECRQRIDKRRAEGDKRDSIMDRILDGSIKPEVPLSDVQINHMCGALIEGAAATVADSLRTSVLFLGKFPEFQDRAREEIDRVCGVDRVPLWKDFESLPFVNCIVKEGLRIHTVAPLGVPHRASQDEWYKGMLIPKDARVIIALQLIHETYYADPSVYNPARYINHPKLANSYSNSPDYENRDHYAYGAGRRICVGIPLAERVQWSILARVLWGFRIEEGDVKLDVDAYTDGLTIEPLPFHVKFVPRSARHAEIVKRDFEQVSEFLAKWD